MTTQQTVHAFAAYHGFGVSQVMPEEAEAIAQAVACHRAIEIGYANLPTSLLEGDMTVGILWQVFERCTERLYAAIVSLVTNCAAGSEIVSRATIEACATFRFILLNRNAHLASFLDHHGQDAERQQRQWRLAAEGLTAEERADHLAACDYRRRATDVLGKLTTQINVSLIGTNVAPKWPNIAERFAQIGEAVSYRTVYARLCAEPHLDAEETLRYFLGKVSSSEIFEALSIETLAFSRFMLAEATRWYAGAAGAYATAYQMAEAGRVCSAAEQTMHRLALAFSVASGAVPSAG